MKRQPLKNEIFSHFSLFSWEKCILCEREFRREKCPLSLDDGQDEDEYDPYTSCGACSGSGCDRCMPQWFEEEE